MKKWRCKVCGYIHAGAEPPEICPVCGAPREEFEEISEVEAAAAAPVMPAPAGPSAVSVVPVSAAGSDVNGGLFAITYGLFMVSSQKAGKLNGQTNNTVFQVTGSPNRLAIGVNKANLTHDYILDSGFCAITVLSQKDLELVKHFGFQSGRTVDKFAGLEYSLGPVTGCPILPDSVAYLECRILPDVSADLGTHTLLIGEVIGGGALAGGTPITYEYYRQNRNKVPAAADSDYQNVVAALNLEFGANRRYQHQISNLQHPRLNGVLEGVARTEGDHIDSALEYLGQRLGGGGGFAKALLYMKLNLDFEKVAEETYRRFARATEDSSLQAAFAEMARSEAGHVNIFRTLVEEMEKGTYPVVFYCPVCGWEVDFGEAPTVGNEMRCPKCGARFRLEMGQTGWELARQE